MRRMGFTGALTSPSLLLGAVLALAWAGAGDAYVSDPGEVDADFLIYEVWPGQSLDVTDGSLTDWERAIPGPSLTEADFTDLDAGGPMPAAVEVRVWLAFARGQMYVAVRITGLPYTRGDRLHLLIDADGSGDRYDGWADSTTVDASGNVVPAFAREEVAFLTMLQAQRYVVSPDTFALGSRAGRDFVVQPPYGQSRGLVLADGWQVELTVQPYDELGPAPELSRRSVAAGGRRPGLGIVIEDIDAAGGTSRLYGLGSAPEWRTRSVGLPLGFFLPHCLPHCHLDVCVTAGTTCWYRPKTAIAPLPWATLKAGTPAP